jgi:hypothetical protein
MKRAGFLLLVISSQLLFGQVLDTILKFPFPFKPLTFFHIPEGNKLYVNSRAGSSGGYWVFKLDCEHRQFTMILHFPIMGGMYPGCGLLPNKHKEKLYWGVYSTVRPDTPGLAVIDITADTIIKMIPAGVINPFNGELCSTWGFGYSSFSDRLFSSAPRDWRSGDFFIIDCTSDSVVMRISGYPTSGRMWWDSAGNKMYFASVEMFDRVDWITVVDCASGQVLGVIPTGLINPTSGIYFPQYRKIYAAGDQGPAVVIDCVTDSIIKRFPQIKLYSTMFPIWEPKYASLVNKVYFPSLVARPPGVDGDTILIIDPQLDSIIGGIHVQPWRRMGAGSFWGMDYAPWSNRLYVHSGVYGTNFISVYDCATDSLVGLTTCQFYPLITQIFCNPVDQKIYILSQEDSAIYIFRDSLVGIAEPEENQPVEVEGITTVVRNVLYLPDTGEREYVLLDIVGRRVQDLKPGANDVRSVVPGVYFIRRSGAGVRKVVVAH